MLSFNYLILKVLRIALVLSCVILYVVFGLYYLVYDRSSTWTSSYSSSIPISGLSMSPPAISLYATILSEIDDQFDATLNASTSDAGT